MVNLKSIYFYFLAVQISILKSLKKIYFTTKLYNRSLVSKTPKQFYFHPNPFLLSLISNFKKYSFKISEIDPNIFWIKQKNFRKEKEIHTFLWLNLIDRKNDGKAIQKIISSWIMKNSGYKKNFWESSVLSKRIISWILNVDIILNNELFEFKRNFLNSIISQTNHLKKNIRFEKDFSKRVEILTALLLSGLVFKEYIENYHTSIKELEKLVKDYFDRDGFPFTRSPNDLIFFTRYLILCRECIKDAQQYVPEFLEEVIKKNLKCIKYILTPNDQVPLFNGGTEKDLKEFNKFIKDFDSVSNEKKNIVGGIQKLRFKNSYIFFDVGAPPDKEFSKSYQSGPLSFEYYLDEKKIITNCGFGSNISSKAELLSRLTSAQSTLTVNDTSVTKFERNRLINKVFGNSIKNIFKISNLIFSEDKKQIKSSATHNGYEGNYGCIFKREISIDKSTGNIFGFDEIIKEENDNPVDYNFRFHLYPGLTAVKTMSGNGVLVQISKNRSLIFTIKDEIIKLEKSIFLGGNKILDNTCITISGNLVNKNKIIHWEIKKKA
jgi:uncharacterized heparinase superfamily protein